MMTSGALDALLQSRQRGGEWISTPHLDRGYISDWDWADFMSFVPEPEP